MKILALLQIPIFFTLTSLSAYSDELVRFFDGDPASGYHNLCTNSLVTISNVMNRDGSFSDSSNGFNLPNVEGGAGNTWLVFNVGNNKGEPSIEYNNFYFTLTCEEEQCFHLETLTFDWTGLKSPGKPPFSQYGYQLYVNYGSGWEVGSTTCSSGCGDISDSDSTGWNSFGTVTIDLSGLRKCNEISFMLAGYNVETSNVQHIAFSNFVINGQALPIPETSSGVFIVSGAVIVLLSRRRKRPGFDR